MLKKLSRCLVGRLSVLPHPSLYRGLKLTYPTDIDGIVQDGQIMSELGTESLGQSVGVVTAADFRSVCE